MYFLLHIVAYSLTIRRYIFAYSLTIRSDIFTIPSLFARIFSLFPHYSPSYIPIFQHYRSNIIPIFQHYSQNILPILLAIVPLICIFAVNSALFAKYPLYISDHIFTICPLIFPYSPTYIPLFAHLYSHIRRLIFPYSSTYIPIFTEYVRPYFHYMPPICQHIRKISSAICPLYLRYTTTYNLISAKIYSSIF